ARSLNSGGGLGDVEGPRVETHLVERLSSGAVNAVVLHVSEAIDPASLGPEDVALLSPLGTPLPVTAVSLPAPSLVRVTFPETGTAGICRLVIGPEIADTAGRGMDQNRDGIEGDGPNDVYEGLFEGLIPGGAKGASTPREGSGQPEPPPLQVLRTTPSFGQAVDGESGVAEVTLTFNANVDSRSLTAEDIQLTGPEGAIAVQVESSWSSVAHRYRDFRLVFEKQHAEGVYTLEVGTGIDPYPGTSAPLEPYHGGFVIGDLVGPYLVARAPGSAPEPSLTDLALEFSEPLDPASVVPENTRLILPDGSLLPADNIDLELPQPTVLTVSFPEQTAPGDYRLEVLSGITDAAGNPLRSSPGERTQARPLEGAPPYIESLTFRVAGEEGAVIQGRVAFAAELFAGLDAPLPHVRAQLWSQTGQRDGPLFPEDDVLLATADTGTNNAFVFTRTLSGDPIPPPSSAAGDGCYYVAVQAVNRFAVSIASPSVFTITEDKLAETQANHLFAKGWLPITFWYEEEGVRHQDWGQVYLAINPAAAPDDPPNQWTFTVPVEATPGGTIQVPDIELHGSFLPSEWIHAGGEWFERQTGETPDIVPIQGDVASSKLYTDLWYGEILLSHHLLADPYAALERYGEMLLLRAGDYEVPSEAYPFLQGMISEAFRAYYPGLTVGDSKQTNAVAPFLGAWWVLFGNAAVQGAGLPDRRPYLLTANRHHRHLERNDFWTGFDGYGYDHEPDVLWALLTDLPPGVGGSGGTGFVPADLFADDAIRVADLEARFVGSNPNAVTGEFVMGACASILWDLLDSEADDGIQLSFARLWQAAKATDDATMRGFYDRVRGLLPGGKRKALARIFIDHGIPVADDAYDQGDGNDWRDQPAHLGSVNAPKSWSGLILAEAEPGDGDWYTVDIPAPEAGSKEDPTVVVVSVDFEERYGDLDLYVECVSGAEQNGADLERGGGQAAVTLELPAGQAHRLLVGVFGHGALELSGGQWHNAGGDMH
ncbi:MAG: hypothetical protein JXR77_17900, partial [Lentisphaeria bacterium]|nr:hypothetical protein [Lentisphaeria bacterium]